MAASADPMIAFDEPDKDGWIVARALEVPGALSQGRTREEARENVLDALRVVLSCEEEPDESKHVKWRGPQGQVSAVPQHGEIGPGLTRSICDVAVKVA